jgi:hypothetical protein
MKFTTVEENVLKCVKKDGECMNNYTRLLFVYWTLIDHVETYDQQTDTYSVRGYRLNQLTSSESISRAFRNLIRHKANFSRGDED